MSRRVWMTLSAVLALWATAAAAQGVSPLERMKELNRSGQWQEAAKLAEDYLRADPARPLQDRCEARTSLAYSQMRLRLDAEAHASLELFDKECRGLPPKHWLRGYAASVRKELGTTPSAPGPPPRPSQDGFWQRADPASLGMDVQALEQHAQLCLRTGADACLVVRKGKIVQEFYSNRYRAPLMAMSSTKSIAGLLVGMLIDDGKIKSVDEPVCSFVKEWCDCRRGKVTLRHLLTMTSGLPRMWEEGVGFKGDKNAFVVGLSPSAEPGAGWDYSNEGVQLLSPILDKAAGEPIQDYAARRLFGPLGMSETRLHLDEKKHAWTYADMETTPRDFARIGLLMLDKGTWQGRRIVSASWVEQSTRPSQEFNPNYGLLWWLLGNPPGYAALGNLDTNLYVFPAQELVVARMQSKPLDKQEAYHSEAVRLFARMVRQ